MMILAREPTVMMHEISDVRLSALPGNRPGPLPGVTPCPACGSSCI